MQVQLHSFRMSNPQSLKTHAKSGVAGGSIRNLLEVVVTDFSGTLAKVEIEVADAASLWTKRLLS